MKRIIIYHGSDHIIKEPKYGFGEKHNDYGLGFYCTSFLAKAKEWANRKTNSGFANKYMLDARGLKVLDLTDSKNFNVLHWISILLEYRKLSNADRALYKRRLDFLHDNFFSEIKIKEYDIIVGYRADDAYFKFPMMFLRNELSIEKLNEIYKIGNLGKQIVVMSEKAFSRLKFITAIEAESKFKELYYSNKNDADIRFEQMRIEEINSDKPKIEDLIRAYDKHK